MALPVPGTGLRPRARRGLRPGTEAGAPRRQPLPVGGRRGRGGRSRGTHGGPEAARSTSRTRAPSSRSTTSGRPPTRRPSTTSASGWPITGSRRPDRLARLATCSSDCRPASASGSTTISVGRANPTSRRRVGSPLVLDHTTLAIQGPPGSGKTFTGARMICSLLAAGKRVGITGTSHKVIGNLLTAVFKAAAVEGVDGRGRSRRATRSRSSTTHA